MLNDKSTNYSIINKKGKKNNNINIERAVIEFISHSDRN